jgi:hypothetical protein
MKEAVDQKYKHAENLRCCHDRHDRAGHGKIYIKQFSVECRSLSST